MASTATTELVTREGGRVDDAAPAVHPRKRRSYAWVGLIPFFGFLVLFLLIPAISVFSEALKNEDGEFGFSSMREAFTGQNFDAFVFSVKFSAGAALIGVVIGTLLAYAAATAQRPKWLRSLVTAFSGVAANMGGLPLAFAFITLIGRQGILTKILEYAGWDLYGGNFTLGEVPGLMTVYSYFNIPLMVLVTLPAIDGLKPAWREASANLGGTTFTYWWRVGFRVLLPSLLGGFLLLFANSFSAYATAKILTDNTQIVSLRIAFYIGGDVSSGEDAVGYSIAAWMIIVMAVCMAGYWMLRKRADRWRT